MPVAGRRVVRVPGGKAEAPAQPCSPLSCIFIEAFMWVSSPLTDGKSPPPAAANVLVGLPPAPCLAFVRLCFSKSWAVNPLRPRSPMGPQQSGPGCGPAWGWTEPGLGAAPWDTWQPLWKWGGGLLCAGHLVRAPAFCGVQLCSGEHTRVSGGRPMLENRPAREQGAAGLGL